MALERYRQKRRFDVTAEPRGTKAHRGGDAFVIQKHAATRLHYDLRLELDGVMKSWAVTKGPSLVPGEKRLAVHVEDHPVAYNTFEGTIPKGEYGGGTVMIWDRGRWIPQSDAARGYAKGHLEFTLEGEKLHGRWHLVRMHKREGERQDPWLLIKSDDAAARSADDPDILDEADRSVASGRSMEEIAAGKPVRKRSARGTVPAVAVWSSNRSALVKGDVAAAASTTPARRPARKGSSTRLPDFVPPCLAQASDTAPDGAGWLHEVKLDGYRMQAHIADGAVRLLTRTGLDWTGKFRSVATALAKLKVDTAIIDGEIVVETASGHSSFSALQDALKSGDDSRFAFYVFDLLHLNGENVAALPLVKRKARLAKLIGKRGNVVQLSEHFDMPGSTLLRHACGMRLEGIVSKRADAPYRSGRTGDWLKIKCSDRQEFVIAGYVGATNDPDAVGALILGYYADGMLQYAGRTGTGFTRNSAREVFRTLAPLRRKTTPFKTVPEEERGARRPLWVEPSCVAEVEFRGWTHGQRLRHASFKGLRDDKDAREVVRERSIMPAPTDDEKTPQNSAGRAGAKHVGAKAIGTNSPADFPLTHPERVYWEDAGVTKRDLAAFYAGIWPWIEPHVANRALSLVRCPQGASGQCFFQKHASAGIDTKHLLLVPEDGDTIIAIDRIEGLLSLVQAGVLEVHVRGSTIARLDDADRIVFDLDPGPDVPWSALISAARDVKARLEALKLASYLKTTGGKGLHVVLPIAPAPWDAVKTFARDLASAMAADDPSRYLATATKAARGGKIYVDYLRNSREATAICAYSTRARPGAPVSVPIAWTELGSIGSANRYTVLNLAQRLARLKHDPWKDIAAEKQKLPTVKVKRR